MNLSDVQGALVAALQAAPGLAALQAAGGILADDGTYPKTPGRQAALSSAGVAVVVWGIESDGLVDSTGSGTVAHRVYVPVVIEELPAVSRAPGGLGQTGEEVLGAILSAIAGKPAATVNPRFKFRLGQQPFDNLGTVNGLQRFVVNVTLLHVIE